MNNLNIPEKCEECNERKPTKVIFEVGVSRGFNRDMIAKFVCNKCEGEQ